MKLPAFVKRGFSVFVGVHLSTAMVLACAPAFEIDFGSSVRATPTVSLGDSHAEQELRVERERREIESRTERVRDKANAGARGELRKEALDAHEKHQAVLAEVELALQESQSCD